MVKGTATLGQNPSFAVTVIVAVTGDDPLLMAVNEGILPDPDAARPMEVLLLVQLNDEPTGVLVKLTAVVVEPLQRVWLDRAFTVGKGFTSNGAVTKHPVEGIVYIMFAVQGAGPPPVTTPIEVIEAQEVMQLKTPPEVPSESVVNCPEQR